MSKVSVSPITNGQDLSNINNNFALIVNALNAGVLWRTNPIGEGNFLNNDIDYNNYNAININTLYATKVVINGIDISAEATIALGAATAAANSATIANTAATNAAASAASAAAQVSISLLKANNLSDLPNVATAKTNLALVKADVGLGNVDNTADVNKPVSTAQATAIAAKLDSTTAASTYATITNLALKAPLASPSFSGTAGFVAATYSGLISPSSTVGIKGTITSDNAQAGSVGEYITSAVTGISISTSNINITSISLTPGDWDVSGWCLFNPAGTTQYNLIAGGISTTSTTFGSAGSRFKIQYSTNAVGVPNESPTPTVRLSLSATTTVYLVYSAVFNTSTATVDGVIRARRVR